MGLDELQMTLLR